MKALPGPFSLCRREEKPFEAPLFFVLNRVFAG